MALRLYGEYKSLSDSTYRVEIYDEDYTGSTYEVVFPNEVAYNFEGKRNVINQYIIPTTAEFSILIENTNHEDFHADLVTSDEGRFFVKVLKDSVVDFIGLITVDQTEIEDYTEPKLVIKAMDGLTYLKTVPYLAAQSQEYILQSQEGKFRANGGVSDTVYTIDSNTTDNFWGGVTQVGTYFAAGTGRFTKEGLYDFTVWLSFKAKYIIPATSDDVDAILNDGGQEVTIKVIKKDENLVDEVLQENSVKFPNPWSQRRIVEFNLTKVRLLKNESVRVEMSWDWGTSNLELTLEKGSYFENKIDATAAVVPVYDSMINHIKNIFSQLPTLSYYAGAIEFFSMWSTLKEVSQGMARTEDYIGIPYNAFTKNVAAQPPEVLSCYEALEEIVKGIPGQLSYRGGIYYLMPYDHGPERNTYDKDFVFIAEATGTFTDDPMECLFKRSFTYLPPLRDYLLNFTRHTSRNLTNDAASHFPNELSTYKYSATVDLKDQALYLTFDIRIHGVPLVVTPITQLQQNHRHYFEASLNMGLDYLKVENEGDDVRGELVYSNPTWTTTPTDRIEIYSDPLTDDQFKKYSFQVTFKIPQTTFSGILLLGLNYIEAKLEDGTTHTPDPFFWDVNSIRLSRFEDHEPDQLYSETIQTFATNGSNSKTIEDSIRWSDLWEQENDPGAMKIWDGDSWETSGTWNGNSYQLEVTKLLAKQQILPAKIVNGTFNVGNMRWGHAKIDSDYYIMMSGKYLTTLEELSGQWYKRTTASVLGRMDTGSRVLTGGAVSEQAQGVNNLSRTSPGPGEVTQDKNSSRVPYEYFVTGISANEITLPAGYELPGMTGLTEQDLMRIFDGSKKDSGNMIPRLTRSHSTHFTPDPDNNKILLFRNADPADKYFFMWYVD